MAGAARGCRGRGSAPQPHSDMAGARDNCSCPTTDGPGRTGRKQPSIFHACYHAVLLSSSCKRTSEVDEPIWLCPKHLLGGGSFRLPGFVLLEMSLGAIPWLPPGPSSAFPGQLGRKLWRVGVGATVVSLVLSLGMGHPRGRARLQMAS